MKAQSSSIPVRTLLRCKYSSKIAQLITCRARKSLSLMLADRIVPFYRLCQSNCSGILAICNGLDLGLPNTSTVWEHVGSGENGDLSEINRKCRDLVYDVRMLAGTIFVQLIVSDYGYNVLVVSQRGSRSPWFETSMGTPIFAGHVELWTLPSQSSIHRPLASFLQARSKNTERLIRPDEAANFRGSLVVDTTWRKTFHRSLIRCSLMRHVEHDK